MLNNNEIESIVKPYFLNKQLDISANVLVEKAIYQWRKESDGQDDITSVIIFFD